MARKKNIIFTDKRYSKKSIMSVIFGLIAMISLVYAVYDTYQQGGQAPIQYGFVVVLIAIYSIIGSVLGIISKVERDKFYLFSYIGLSINICNLVGIVWILFVGMM